MGPIWAQYGSCIGIWVLHGLHVPSGLISRLDRVLRSAARLIGRIPKYASVSAYMRDVLHWLPASQRISYRIAALVWRCLAGCAPSYLLPSPPSGSAFLCQGSFLSPGPVYVSSS